MGIQKESLVDLVIDRIKQYIAENHLQPNDKFLSEKELVEKLQVSRTVVREALKSLQSVGIITIKPGNGNYITDTKSDSIITILKHHYDTYGVKIKELIEIREIIELGALRLIVEKQEHVHTEELHQLNESYYQAILEKKDTKNFDRLFHQSLIKLTKNETYYTFSNIINEYFALIKMDVVEKDEALIESYQQHSDIIQAIQTKNLPLAQQIMTKHFEPIYIHINQMEEEIICESN